MRPRRVTSSSKKNLLKKKNVVGVGYGHKISNGVDTGEPCVSILVEKKVGKKKLRKSALVPNLVDGIKTDVIEVGKIVALPATTDKHRPAPGGVSIGHKNITAGTFGCLVTDGIDTFILSNNHVIANSNNAELGDEILQPGPADGGTLEDQIATLEDFEPIKFQGISGEESIIITFIRWILCALFGYGCDEDEEDSSVNLFDAAVARPLDLNNVKNEILEVGTPAGSEWADINQEVQKTGRTTGHTRGKVLQMDADINVSYGLGKTAIFENQIISDIHSQGGDSGSAILNNNNQVVGLLFAGSDTITVLSPIQPILDTFEVEIKV